MDKLNRSIDPIVQPSKLINSIKKRSVIYLKNHHTSPYIETLWGKFQLCLRWKELTTIFEELQND